MDSRFIQYNIPQQKKQKRWLEEQEFLQGCMKLPTPLQ